MNAKTSRTRKPLAAIVGAACCATLVAYVPKFEGVVLRGYKDPIGIVTACAGHTATAVLGRAYTPQECEQLLQADLVDHAEGVLACTPSLTSMTGPKAAAISFAFNVGVAKYCGSTMARKFNAGDVLGACAELSRWTYAGGRELPGLVTRRQAERAICEGRTA
jgi:lysozyme